MPLPKCLEEDVAARVDGVLGHEGPANLACAVFEEGLEGGADGSFAGEVEVGDLVEGGAVGLDGLVGVFEAEIGHGNWSFAVNSVRVYLK